MLEYEKLLNEAQYEAATCDDRAVLVVAGAGSGKTRTIVYRLAWLLEHDVDPTSLLLLTFTRKAAREMINRANELLMQDASGVLGGTFHSFAYKTLKMWPPEWLEGRQFTLMDQSDALNALQRSKTALKIGAKNRSFPKSQTIQGFISKARNKEKSIEEIISHDAYHLSVYAEDIEKIAKEYRRYCREQGLMDYDDLLFELEDLLKTNTSAQESLHRRFNHIMVDEYQDTNPVQARIVRLLSNTDDPESSNHVMAVGDEAQSIYAFRGSTIRNILDFPNFFPGTRVIRLEENYRSTQPVLDVANTILSNAAESFQKVLFTRNTQGLPVFLYEPYDEERQAEMVVEEILSLRSKYAPEEIAVLFRSSYHSYLVETALNRSGVPFKKFGGLKYTEAAHIKDCLAFVRLIHNPTDITAFSRLASMHAGIGPKTIERMFAHIRNGDDDGLTQAIRRFPDFANDLSFIDSLREEKSPSAIVNEIITYFQPRLETRYADDWTMRKQSLEEIVQVASSYETVDDFVAELVLDPSKDEEDERFGKFTLSTIHSAKGLEWDAVLLIDLVYDRFPTRHALNRQEDFEEERRLMYVACTRARKELHLYTPKRIFNRVEHAPVFAEKSPFIDELKDILGTSVISMGQKLSTHYAQDSAHDSAKNSKKAQKRSAMDDSEVSEKYASKRKICHHKIFGYGEILKEVGDRCEVKFTQHGVKVLRKEYLDIE